jgi:hypothetical protein
VIAGLSQRIRLFVTGCVGVIVIALGFVIAPILSCNEIHKGYGPSLFICPDGTFIGSTNPHPYFDMLTPWLLFGLLILLWAAYQFQNESKQPQTPNKDDALPFERYCEDHALALEGLRVWWCARTHDGSNAGAHTICQAHQKHGYL